MKKIILLLTFTISSTFAFAQGQLSGDLMMNVNFFQRDSAINAANNPLYDNFLSGGESWLGLRYSYKGFTATVRADAFHNSNRYNPTQALNGWGLGAWQLSKRFSDLTITAGYIYDQIGSGLMFRSYEDRGLLIDNALVGLHLKYQLTDNIELKGFTGQSKFLFDQYKPVIKGFAAEGNFSIGKEGQVFIVPGIGALNRTLDQTSMEQVVSTINSQDSATRFVPMYNMYAFTAYNTLSVGNFNWYIEGSYKTHESIVNLDGLLEDADGNILFTTLSYARKGFAVNFTGKRTENYEMRTSPNEVLIRGMMNWQPIVARLRPQRLLARYSPPSQNLSEMSGGVDVLISPNEDLSITLNYAHSNTLNETKLYREVYFDAEYRGWDNFILMVGTQYMEYNQELFQIKPGVPLLFSTTPFFELTYKISKTKSIRTEWEYQMTDQDFGSWIFGLIEYNIAPRWSISISDMYNLKAGPIAVAQGAAQSIGGAGQHYYQIFGSHTRGPHRFTLSYVKQVEGINCTGGVCRYEPAFSGVKFGVSSTF